MKAALLAVAISAVLAYAGISHVSGDGSRDIADTAVIWQTLGAYEQGESEIYEVHSARIPPPPQVHSEVRLGSQNITKDQPLKVTYTDTFPVPPGEFESDKTFTIFYVPMQISVEFETAFRNTTVSDPYKYPFLGNRTWAFNSQPFEEVGRTHVNTATLTLNGNLNHGKDFLSMSYGGGTTDYYLLEQTGDVVTLTRQDWTRNDVTEYFASYERQHMELQRPDMEESGVGGTPSPLKQLKGGIPISEIRCSDGKVLVQNGYRPACVTPSSADTLQQRGWVLVPQQAADLTSSPAVMPARTAATNNAFAVDLQAWDNDGGGGYSAMKALPTSTPGSVL